MSVFLPSGHKGPGPRFGLAALLVFSAAGLLWAGLSLPNAEFRVANLLPGRVYVGSRDVLKTPYTVVNKTGDTLDFSVRAYAPSPEQLKEDYQAIPDASWVTFASDYFTMKPGETGATEFYIAVPDDKSLLGKKYQVQLVAQTIGGASGAVQLGLGGRAFFVMDGNDAPWSPEQKKEMQLGVRFLMDPNHFFAEGVKLGKKAPLSALLGKPLLVRNDGDYPARISVASAEVKGAYVQPPYGYEAADPRFLKVSTRKLLVPPHGTAELKGAVSIPDRPEFRGKKYYLVVQMDSLDKAAAVRKFGRIFIQTEN